MDKYTASLTNAKYVKFLKYQFYISISKVLKVFKSNLKMLAIYSDDGLSSLKTSAEKKSDIP